MYGVTPDLASEVTERVARFAKAQPTVASGQYYYAMNLWRAPVAPGAAAADETLKTVESCSGERWPSTPR